MVQTRLTLIEGPQVPGNLEDDGSFIVPWPERDRAPSVTGDTSAKNATGAVQYNNQDAGTVVEDFRNETSSAAQSVFESLCATVVEDKQVRVFEASESSTKQENEKPGSSDKLPETEEVPKVESCNEGRDLSSLRTKMKMQKNVHVVCRRYCRSVCYQSLDVGRYH